MWDIVNYQTELVSVNFDPTPITGRYLAHNRLGRVHRAFLAADIVTGARPLIHPTIAQAAMLAGINRTYAFWAVMRLAERAQIEAGHVPLAPRASVTPAPRPAIVDADIDDHELVCIAASIGPDRWLAIGVAAEATNN